MDIFVGSLPFKLEESELRVFFEQYGEVTSVKIIIDVNTRQNKGFGFVEMPNVSEGLKAIEGLNGFEIGGRALVVNKSEDKKDKKPGGFSGPNKSPGGGFGKGCLLYTSDAADERSSVDLGGRRIIKKKNNRDKRWGRIM